MCLQAWVGCVFACCEANRNILRDSIDFQPQATMAALDLKSTVSQDASEDEQRVLVVLNDALQIGSKIAPADASSQIDHLCPKEKPDEMEDFLWRSWSLMIRVAQTVPSSRASQSKLVSIIAGLTELPSTNIEVWGVRLTSLVLVFIASSLTV